MDSDITDLLKKHFNSQNTNKAKKTTDNPLPESNFLLFFAFIWQAVRSAVFSLPLIAKRLGYAIYSLGISLYKICYFIGIQTMRNFISIKRVFKKITRPILSGIYKFFYFILFKRLKSLYNSVSKEYKRIKSNCHKAVKQAKLKFSQGTSKGIKYIACLPFYAIKSHKKALFSLFNRLAPIAAAIALVFTVRHFASLNYGLAVDYNGQTIGYISDEQVYENAANMAYDRVINTDNSFKITSSPKLTMKVIDKSMLKNESDICDEILKSSSDSIAKASGLYIDDKFKIAVSSRSQLEETLNGMLNKNQDNSSQNCKSEFVQKIKIVDGLYPKTSIDYYDNMEEKFCSDLTELIDYTVQANDTLKSIANKYDVSQDLIKNINNLEDSEIIPGQVLSIEQSRNFLQVKTTYTEKETVSVPYNKVTEKNSKKYLGYKEITTKGEDGKNQNILEVTKIDGKIISKDIISTDVIKKPVSEITTIGDMKSNSESQAGDGIAQGNFVWPIPSCRTLSSPFGYRWGRLHKGLDISGGASGASILAADGGVVEFAGWHNINYKRYGYGKYVIINHRNGYKTYYAHLSDIKVSAGQKVAQGELIGLGGNTGYSTGAHLHFEIRENGTPKNPYPYIKGK